MKRFGNVFETEADAIAYAKKMHKRVVFKAEDEKGVWFFAWSTFAYSLPVVWQGW